MEFTPDFAARFLRRYLLGREYEVGLPIEAKEYALLMSWFTGRPALVDELEAILQKRAAAHFVSPGPILFDEHVLELTVALYQLLFAFHASVQQGRVSRARLEALCRDVMLLLERMEPPTARHEILRNHLILEPFLRSFRLDTTVRFSRRAIRFYGQPVHLNWFARRRPHTDEQSSVDLAAQAFDGPLAPAMRLLLSRSPLSKWLYVHRLFGHFQLETNENVLEERDACRLICNRWLELGSEQCLPSLGECCFSMRPTDGSRESRVALARMLLNHALSAAYWRPERHLPRVFDETASPKLTLYQPMHRSQSYTTSEDLQKSQRLLFLRRAWGAVLLLLRQSERLAVPEWDRQSETVKRLTEQLEATPGALVAANEMQNAVALLMS
ncbi:MAG: hypothetical protein RBU37_18015 [Myxococcota bacterium]|jgi:hypothetical protein|nr:hypothetical protein [Myxococcota bacterium]